MDSNVIVNQPLLQTETGSVAEKPRQPMPTFRLGHALPREYRARPQETAQRARTGPDVRPIGTSWQETLPGMPGDPRSLATRCTYEVVDHRPTVAGPQEVIRCMRRERITV